MFKSLKYTVIISRMYSGWHVLAYGQPYHDFSKICSQPYLVSAVNRIIATNTLCQKKGKFGQKYQLLEFYLF